MVTSEVVFFIWLLAGTGRLVSAETCLTPLELWSVIVQVSPECLKMACSREMLISVTGSIHKLLKQIPVCTIIRELSSSTGTILTFLAV